MANSLSSILALISSFRQTIAKDSITPDSLGYLLKIIVESLQDYSESLLLSLNQTIEDLLSQSESHLNAISQLQSEVVSIKQTINNFDQLISAGSDWQDEFEPIIMELQSSVDGIVDSISNALPHLEGVEVESDPTSARLIFSRSTFDRKGALPISVELPMSLRKLGTLSEGHAGLITANQAKKIDGIPSDFQIDQLINSGTIVAEMSEDDINEACNLGFNL